MYSCLNNFVCYPIPPPKKKTYLDPKSINNPKIRVLPLLPKPLLPKPPLPKPLLPKVNIAQGDHCPRRPLPK